MNIHFVYITTAGMDEAETIGRALISERLAACVNLIDKMKSMYWWENEIQEDSEVILIAKTRESLVEPLIERVKSLHSYDCPCIVAFPVSQGNQAFLEWIMAETPAPGP